MRALRRRAFGLAAAAATGAVVLVTASAATAQIGPNQGTFRDRVGDGIKTGMMGVQLFNYGNWIRHGDTFGPNGPLPGTPAECINTVSPRPNPNPADNPTCHWDRLERLFRFLQSEGVTNVELFGHASFPGNSDLAGLQRYRALLDQYGLHAGGWHGNMSEADWDARIAAAKVLGSDYIGSGGFPSPGINSYQDTLATAQALNRLGKRSIEAGLGPVYFHNHQTEFTNKYVDDGVLKPAIDIIMERTDPRYVVAEIDVKWSSDALDDVTGTQTAAYINKPAYQSRVQMLHIKDGINIANPFPASAPHVATGSGEIDFKPIFAAAANRVRYYHQEHDGGTLTDADVSLSNLKGINTASVASLLALPPTFPSVAANTPAAGNVQPVLVQNTGDQPLTITNVQVQGTDAADFAIVSHNCTTANGAPADGLPAGTSPATRGTCVVNVGFKPTRTGYTSVARLQFTSNSDSANEQVLLVGKSTNDALATVGGNVPSVLQLNVVQTGGSFGTFVPGVNATYNTALAASATTTTGDAALSVADLTGNQPGKLVNGAFALANPVGVRALGLGDDPATAFTPVTDAPQTLKSWGTPVTAAPLTLGFRQQIGNTEALRAGNYSKTLTFTLSTTTP
jgi:sugar phosphate isomerase/epimerase